MFSEMFDNYEQKDNYRSSSDYNNQMGRMSQFKNMFNSMRFKRAAGDNLDLGDRLVEKLAEQKHQMEAKIGNMTCVMRELNVLDASNNIDVRHEEGHPEVHHAQRVVQEQVRAPP